MPTLDPSRLNHLARIEARAQGELRHLSDETQINQMEFDLDLATDGRARVPADPGAAKRITDDLAEARAKLDVLNPEKTVASEIFKRAASLHARCREYAAAHGGGRARG